MAHSSCGCCSRREQHKGSLATGGDIVVMEQFPVATLLEFYMANSKDFPHYRVEAIGPTRLGGGGGGAPGSRGL
jgi:hypothetical protein